MALSQEVSEELKAALLKARKEKADLEAEIDQLREELKQRRKALKRTIIKKLKN